MAIMARTESERFLQRYSIVAFSSSCGVGRARVHRQSLLHRRRHRPLDGIPHRRLRRSRSRRGSSCAVERGAPGAAQRLHTVNPTRATRFGGRELVAAGYGYGLVVEHDVQFGRTSVGHAGGLPGFAAHMHDGIRSQDWAWWHSATRTSSPHGRSPRPPSTIC